VTEVHGHVAAWLSFSSFYGRPAYDKTAEISVYVDEAHRKQGLGSYLLTGALLMHRPSGSIPCWGSYRSQRASLVLFEKFGFQRWGVLPKVAALDNIERDLVIVGRRI